MTDMIRLILVAAVVYSIYAYAQAHSDDIAQALRDVTDPAAWSATIDAALAAVGAAARQYDGR